MKKTVVLMVVVLVAAGACTQQRQEQKGQAPYPGAVMMKSPEEIRQLEQLAQQAPKNADAWIALGNALMDSQRYGEAVDAYQKALVLDPKNVDVRVDRGTCLKNLGKFPEAAEEYRRAIQVNPNHAYAHRNLGVVLAFDLHDRAAGAKEFEKYLQIAPTAADADAIRKTIQELTAGK